MKCYKNDSVVEYWQFTRINYNYGVPSFIRRIINNSIEIIKKNTVTLYSHNGGEVIAGDFITSNGDTIDINENDYIVINHDNTINVYSPLQFDTLYTKIN